MRRACLLLTLATLGYIPSSVVLGWRHATPVEVPSAPSPEVHGRRAAARLLDAAGLTLSRAELPTHWQTAVVVDIDADGDEDLVANVGSLELGVWLNDGTGRLTRVRPVDGPARWLPQPPTPTYDNQTWSLDAAAPDEAPSVRPEPARAGPAFTSAGALDDGAIRPTLHDPSAPSSPRAPPLA